MKTPFRISPAWWPVLVAASPVVVPLLVLKNRRFRADKRQAEEFNRKALSEAKLLDLPEVDFLQIQVLVEEKTEPGFLGAPGVSYLLKTDLGSLLFDVAFGSTQPALAHNANRLGLGFDDLDAVAISHLHFDHMGGLPAHKAGRVAVPLELGLPSNIPCFLPDTAETLGLRCVVVEKPGILDAGIASTGPLARSLFFMGCAKEQSLLVNVRGKGIVGKRRDKPVWSSG